MCDCIEKGKKPAYVWSLNNPKDGLVKLPDSNRQAIVSNDTKDTWLVNLGEDGVVQKVIIHKPPYTRQINGDKTITVGRWITMESYLQTASPES